MVRTIEELNKLVEEGKSEEITQEEWNALNHLIKAVVDLIEPIEIEIQAMAHEFLVWLEEVTSNLD